MTTESAGPGSAGGGLDNAAYAQLRRTPEFERLRHAFRGFVFPMTAAFLTWYLLYVVLSAYARDFMGKKVVGEINVALIFGLLQFVSTFLIAWAYERYARRRLEPLADGVRAKADQAVAGAGAAAPGAAATTVAEPETATEAPATEPPAAEASATETPATETPAAETPAAEKPATGTPAAGASAAGTSAAETPAAGSATEAETAAEKPAGSTRPAGPAEPGAPADPGKRTDPKQAGTGREEDGE
ncbi:DUF485 domain-containing protein [Actinomadura fibrosa]|uniref:DUF485 domain-containing protein n=1 Tax=Actinomadura fibrosa TaxID=111802 RepID=A0ABW2Y198_9ACTN|nr:DUF485 domain-containing protein [Actinomadura fibrosa]